MEKAEIVYRKLQAGFKTGSPFGGIQFTLNGTTIDVLQNNIVGNLIEEWLDRWMEINGIEHVYNRGQTSPDFFLTAGEVEKDLLEVKTFTGGPNFDISAYHGFVNDVVNRPYRLYADYLLIKYAMEGARLRIQDVWLKKIWEISCPSDRWPVKTQTKANKIYNLRPAIWYSRRIEYPTFKNLEHFLSALEQTIYDYPDTHNMAFEWKRKLAEAYKAHYGRELTIPRWTDVKLEYAKRAKNESKHENA